LWILTTPQVWMEFFTAPQLTESLSSSFSARNSLTMAVASVIPTPAPIAVYTTLASAISRVILACRPEPDKPRLAS
jgi:hypothetical protein